MGMAILGSLQSAVCNPRSAIRPRGRQSAGLKSPGALLARQIELMEERVLLSVTPADNGDLDYEQWREQTFSIEPLQAELQVDTTLVTAAETRRSTMFSHWI